MAKEPTYAQAQIMSLEMAMRTGFTNIPIEKDASNSQVQVISCLIGDPALGSLCNIITDNSVIQDYYGRVAKELEILTGLKFNRNQLKKTSMIDGYGAGRKLLEKQLKEDCGDLYFEGLVDLYKLALDRISPTLNRLKQTIASIWDNKRTRWQWTLPNGNVTDYNTVASRIITLKPYGLFDIDMIVSCISPTDSSSGLLVNIIHSIDAYIASEMVLRCPFEIITIHDAFRCHPNHSNEMARIYVEIMAEITDSRLLEDIVEELTGIPMQSIPKQFCGADVLKSRYAVN